MSPYYQYIVECFNDIMIPAFQDVSRKKKTGIRVGGLLFSDKFTPIWRGFKNVNELPSKLISINQCEQACLRGTNLYEAMLSGIIWTELGREYIRLTNHVNTTGSVLIITDGENNCGSGTIEEVRKVADMRDPREFKLIMAGLKTNKNSPSEDFFNSIANETGFTPKCFDLTQEHGRQQEKFRRIFEILSSSVNKK